MTVKELKAYLDKYRDDEEICFIAADVKNRIAWPHYQIGVAGATDTPAPVICLELHESEPFDTELIQAAEEDERNSMLEIKRNQRNVTLERGCSTQNGENSKEQ